MFRRGKVSCFFVHCEAITKTFMPENVLILLNFKQFKCNTVKLFCRNMNVDAIHETFPPWNILRLRLCWIHDTELLMMMDDSYLQTNEFRGLYSERLLWCHQNFADFIRFHQQEIHYCYLLFFSKVANTH